MAGTLVDFHYTYAADEQNISQKRFDHRTYTPYNTYTYDEIDRLTGVTYLDSDTEIDDCPYYPVKHGLVEHPGRRYGIEFLNPDALMDQISEWLKANQHPIQLLGTLSLLLLVMTLAAIPFVVMKLPRDYFSVKRRKPSRKSGRFNLLWTALVIMKNLLGFVIIMVGLVLLLLPGQGVVTILIGLALTNFPGKFAMERWIVRQPGVSGTLNWIRSKVGKPPFVIPAPEPGQAT